MSRSTIWPQRRLKEWFHLPEPLPAASGILVQPLRAATGCEFDRARKNEPRHTLSGSDLGSRSQYRRFADVTLMIRNLTRTTPCESLTRSGACGGVADAIRLRSENPQAECDPYLEPACECDRMGAALAPSLRACRHARTGGLVWSELELQSPPLQRKPLRPRELPMQIRLVRLALAVLWRRPQRGGPRAPYQRNKRVARLARRRR